MFIQRTQRKTKDKAYHSVVLMENYREGKKVKRRTDRYKNLGDVEFAFRTMKTTIEEMRPIFVRNEQRTKGHVFVVMLAYMIVKYLSNEIENLEYTRNLRSKV